MTAPVIDKPATDVNEAFTSTRITQIENATKRQAELDAAVARGDLTKLNDGRYRVNSGYDAGEYLTSSGMPQHGLDLTQNGEAALYSAVQPWHGLGNVIPGGTSDIDEVMKLGGMLYGVHATPVRFVDHTGKLQEMPGKFATFRDDTGAGLGVVGTDYANGGIIQNRSSFEFLQDLFEKYGMFWQSAGTLRGGRRTFVSMELPEGVIIDAEGVNDHIKLYAVSINSFDGRTPFMIIITPWRPVCANTERFAIRDAKTRWTVRHTNRALSNLQIARTTLRMTMTYAEKFKAEEEALAGSEMNLDEFLALVQDEFWPAPDEDSMSQKGYKIAEKRHSARMDELATIWRNNTNVLGRTAYASERAFTEYTDHFRPIQDNPLKGTGAVIRATQALEGYNDEDKAKVHKRLLLRVR